MSEPKHLHKMQKRWLFPMLVAIDQLPDIGTGRWSYWSNTLLDADQQKPGPIPTVKFGRPNPDTIKNITQTLKIAEQAGVRHSRAFEAWVVWVLHGLGCSGVIDPDAPDQKNFLDHDTPDLIPDLKYAGITPKILDGWYETFNLGLMIQYPADYCAYFAQGGANKDYNPYTGSGFFATPIEVSKLLCDIQFGTMDRAEARRQKVHDPCCGTGSMLLAASNHSLRLSGIDINRFMVLCTILQGYLYAPWMVWWPDFSRWGGPPRNVLEEWLFGPEDEQPEPIALQQPALFDLSQFEPAQQRRTVDDRIVRAYIRDRLERRAGLTKPFWEHLAA